MEYKVIVNQPGLNLEDALNEAAGEGWALAQVVPPFGISSKSNLLASYPSLILEREVHPQPGIA